MYLTQQMWLGRAETNNFLNTAQKQQKESQCFHESQVLILYLDFEARTYILFQRESVDSNHAMFIVLLTSAGISSLIIKQTKKE